MTDNPAAALATLARAFDYTSLDDATANLAKQVADRIRAHQRQASAAIITIGNDLRLIKDRLGYGLFGEWLRQEFGWHARTAQRFMRAAEVFGDENDNVSVLAPTTIYLLSSKSTPETCVAKVIADLEAGEPVDQDRICAEVREARERARAARIEKKLSQRQRERKAEGARKHQEARTRAEQRLVEQAAAEQRVLDFLVAKLDIEDVAELVALMAQAGNWNHQALATAAGLDGPLQKHAA